MSLRGLISSLSFTESKGSCSNMSLGLQHPLRSVKIQV